MMRHGITVTVHRSVPGGTDQHGDPLPGTVETHDIEGCALAPRTDTSIGEVDTRSRHGIVVGWNLFAAYDADIVNTDRIEIDGELFDVDGQIGRWRSPFTGREHGLEVALKRPEG